ncbi:peptide deformylase [Brevibacterium samyangense]|uniref:Peptide deformylase n=1 Tax=Brevibacterium samyangense TaxID=366888 RepID=A0ABP5ELJ6_9MICO
MTSVPTTASPKTVREQIESVLAMAELNNGIVPVVEAGDPVLRTVTEEFDGQVDDATLAQLAEVMHATMKWAPGVGLAAPQVGIALRMFVAEDPATVSPAVAEARERHGIPSTVLLNSYYEGVGDEKVAFYEGCLSIPGYQAVVSRHRTIALRGTDLSGAPVDREVSGWEARIVAHETDHLDGVLYTDKAELRSLATTKQVMRWWNQPTAQEAARALGFELPASPIL